MLSPDETLTMEPVEDAPARPPERTTPTNQARKTPAAPNGRRRKVSIAIFVGVLLVGGVGGLWMYISTLGLESTDDAFIASNVYRVSAQVEGRLTAVPVSDNEVVEQGVLLATIDPSDYEARAAQARAAMELAKAQARESEVQVGIIDATTASALEEAKAALAAAEAKLQQEQAGLESANAELTRAKADLERYSQLSDRAVTQQRLDIVRSTATTAEAQALAAEKRVAAAAAELTAAKTKVPAAEADRERVSAARAEVDRRHAEVRQAEAALEEAELELSYCEVRAPAAGRVTNKSVLAGEYIRVGQSLLGLVSPDVWVVANFKETQLRRMHPGQPVTIHVDAYDVDFEGHVESIQSGSGAQFSLLPPQNATGNYVKVVQRVPVKIVFEEAPDPSRYQLGPGMSVVPRVKVR